METHDRKPSLGMVLATRAGEAQITVGMSKPMILGGDGGGILRLPFTELSEERRVGLFLEAAKPATEWFLGVELELFAFRVADRKAALHADIAQVLEQLRVLTGMAPTFERNGALTGLTGGGQIVSLEPGGQLEFATRPHRALKELREEILTYCDRLAQAGEAAGVGFWALGHQPYVDVATAPYMPRPRYERMRAFLSQRGARALQMMHLTGSIQCTVDFQSEANLVNKVRTAARVSPFLSALVAASPFSGGRANGFQTVRYQIWLETDDPRCGVWPEMYDAQGLTIGRYIARTLEVPPMFFIRDGVYREVEDKPFAAYVRDGFDGEAVTVGDFLDHLTTFFPEVRPKGYVELRGADCLTAREAVAVAGFWRALLDEEDTRQEVDDRLSKMDYAAVRALQPQVAQLGLRASSATGPVLDTIRWLCLRAYERLSNSAPDCAECVLPLVERAQAGRSPADELLEAAQKDGLPAALRLRRLRARPE